MKGRGVQIGYSLSSEERQPEELVEHARLAEDTGFAFAMISDHFHPWTARQGSSPFVWLLSWRRQRRESQRACHGPALAAARDQQDMLEEAIGVLRMLHEGGERSHHGRSFEVRNARIYNLPDQPVPICVAAAGDRGAELAGRAGDGIICTEPSAKTLEAFDRSGGAGKPRYGQVTVCWARTEDEAVRTAHEIWPNAAMSATFKNEVPLTAHIEQAARTVRPEDVRKTVVCGPDAQSHVDSINEFVKAGFDHVFVRQIGPDQEGFMRFYAQEVLPNVEALAA